MISSYSYGFFVIYEAMHGIYQRQLTKLASEVADDKLHIRRVAATTEAKRRELAWLTEKEDNEPCMEFIRGN